MVVTAPISVAIAVAGGLLLLRTILSLRSLLYLLGRWWRWVDDRAHPHQTFDIPRFSADSDENPLYRSALAYVGSLPSLDDADRASLSSATLSSGRPTDFFLRPDNGQPVRDSFLGSRVAWTSHPDRLSLSVRRHDRRRILRPYLQHVESVADEIRLRRRRDIRLFTAGASGWTSVPFTHPATFDTIAMESELKGRLRADLESFLGGRAYYHRLGRVWRRSYLLHGQPGTGKSVFVAAMAKFLSYNIYSIDVSRSSSADEIRSLLLKTTPRSVVLVEGVDRCLEVLDLMDGIFSCCLEERVMVFTMSGGGGGGEEKEAVDPAVIRPGRIDVQVHFPMCDFTAFKTLASSYLGLKDHKLYPQVEEGFQSGATLSPAEVGEIMIAHRGSPSRAIKTVISALQRSLSSDSGRLGRSGSGHGSDAAATATAAAARRDGGPGIGFGKEATIREFRKLYGFMRIRNGSKREGLLLAAEGAAAAPPTSPPLPPR